MVDQNMILLPFLLLLAPAIVWGQEGYMMKGEPLHSPDGVEVTLELVKDGPFPSVVDGEIASLLFHAQYQSNERLHIKIIPTPTNQSEGRWEVPLNIIPPENDNHDDPLYSVELSNDPLFNFKIIRKSNGRVLFDSSVAQSEFVYADQYLSLQWGLPPQSHVYGIGENEQWSFRHDFSENKTYPLWAMGHNTEGTVNLYGVQPYYTVLEEDGNAHSVVLLNSNAQEFNFRSDDSIRYVTIGGIMDFYFFLGPTPENTVQQYTSAIGRAPLPPYWALGFHLCRYGYDSIENMKAAVDRMEQYDIPHDVQYGDIDIMDRRLDFTYSEEHFPGLPEYIRELKTQKGIKFITILDPVISIGEPRGEYRAYDLGEEMDVWVKRSDGTNAEGRMFPPDNVYFPDFSNPTARTWWITMIQELHSLLEYDGLWIDMNEPVSFVDGDIQGCSEGTINNPLYLPPIVGGKLYSGSLCPDSVQYAGQHYNTHTLFGWFESEPTLAGTVAGTGKRSFVLSRSNFVGSGKWVAHWLGDNYATWNDMRYSIIGMLQYNHFGIPMVGADICGHNYDSPLELCQRWQQLGSFYPFSRNHNGNGHMDQDPGAYGEEMASSTRTVLRIRYSLLPYLYTLLHLHHIRGDTVARPLWHIYPQDPVTPFIDRQFLWGSGLLVTPVLEEGSTTVEGYFPNGRFYNYYDGGEVEARGSWVNLNAPMDVIPLHVHGGNIIPFQEPARNTEMARNNPFGLIIALDDEGKAEGGLYFDDGDSIDPHATKSYFLVEYNYENGQLSTTIVTNGYPGMSSKRLDTVRLLGHKGAPIRDVLVNGVYWFDYTVNPTTGEITLLHLQVTMTDVLDIQFS